MAKFYQFTGSRSRTRKDFYHGLLRQFVIPTRHFDDLPEDYLNQLSSIFVEPFLTAYDELGLSRPLMLTVIAKAIHLEPGIQRDELLTWATAHQDVHGIYLIFENSFTSKQIKDPGYLAGMLRFIKELRLTGMEVHVGYSGLEGLLLSMADPTSVSVGSYENLRSFDIRRLETRERQVQQGPRPRIYSGRLLQWLDDSLLPPLRELVPNWQDLFDDSPYKEYLLNSGSVLNFQRSEIYKHYFWVFASQVVALPALADRIDYLRDSIQNAIGLFEAIRESGVYLDADSDDSHLAAWLNALSMYEASAT